jgi:hypothetical protein
VAPAVVNPTVLILSSAEKNCVVKQDTQIHTLQYCMISLSYPRFKIIMISALNTRGPEQQLEVGQLV